MKTLLSFITLSMFISACVNTEQKTITVYKSPTCGCCKKWVSHLESNGLIVESHDVEDVSSYKIKAGITPELASCHTAFVDDYVIEGHVPANDILRLLKEKPDIKGLSVPAMPAGSPGMEMGDRKDPYNVIAIHKNNKLDVYSKH